MAAGKTALIETPFRRAMEGAGRPCGGSHFFSFFINLLMLTSSIYMLQV